MTTTTPLRERIKQLEEQIQQQKEEAEEQQRRYLRLAADFDNYKKRTRQEQAELAQYATAELVAKLLPAIDNLHRVLKSAEDLEPQPDQGWLKGLQLTVQNLDEVLKGQGLEPIEAIGKPFDPNLHEAIGHEETDEHPEDTVVDEIRRGYRLHEKVVRPALVKVSRKKALAG